MEWYGKPYYSLDAWFKNEYGGKCRKISIDGGFTCPNRDGTLGYRGCIFCSEGGSGDFAIPLDKLHQEILDMENGVKKLHSGNHNYVGYVAYFQAFTSTYGPVDKLREKFFAALSEEKIIGISIGTRPDCLGEEVIALLQEMKTAFPDKFIWIELGLQTIHKETSDYIRRGYELNIFENAVRELKRIDIPFVVHLIIGLPGETPEMMYESVKYVNDIHPFGIKLQLLHVLKNTDLASDYLDNRFKTLTMEEYIDIILHCVLLLREDIVIHRITGDGDRDILISPEWSIHKMTVLNAMHSQMKSRRIRQGAGIYE